MICAFRAKDQIEGIIRQYEGVADKIVVAVSKKSWKGNLYDEGTFEEATKTSATVIFDYWEKEHEQRNVAMEYLRDMDYIIVSHCDTYFTKQDLIKLKKMKLTKRHYTCKVLTYWKDLETVINPDISLPTIIVRSDVRFENLINIHMQEVEPEVLPITCYHLSWTGSKSKIRDKITSYSHADEISVDWLEKVWNNDSAVINLAPTNATDYKGLRTDPLPDEIRAYL